MQSVRKFFNSYVEPKKESTVEKKQEKNLSDKEISTILQVSGNGFIPYKSEKADPTMFTPTSNQPPEPQKKVGVTNEEAQFFVMSSSLSNY